MADETTPEEVPATEGGEKLKAEEAEVEDAAPDAKKEKKEWTAVRLGPKSFATPEEMIKYFSWILNNMTMNQDMNDYEFSVVDECLRRAHPDAEKKIGCGVKTFQIRNHPEHDTRCYMVLRTDGSCEDFSYRKCVEALFPGFSTTIRSSGGGGRGGRGGRGGERGRKGGARGGGRGARGGGGGRGRR
jgi:uncharacterized membrane protein YgcG